MTTTGRLLVSVADGHTADDVARACAAAGLAVEKVLSGIGVVVGTCADPEALRGVTGVAAVEPDREVRLDRDA
ncbi:hypothetical protein [Pseudonocardia spirodelae]|uniref:Ketohydroxyglutarate aldolase n=1 Tax=Pseudonocardia spirodelae TaxID=3133431 RepID=A0ABU8TBE4_9PSEU